MSLRKNQYRKIRLVCIIIMSAANSAAKKRRAPPSTEPIRPPVSNMPGKAQPNVSSGLTLPQVIALIDTRLVRLETVTKTLTDSSNSETPVMDSISPEIMEEFNTRFEIIAEEVANIKNIVINLQSYTMNVNKMLLQERKREFGVSSDEIELIPEEDVEEEELLVEEEVVLGEVAPQWTTA